MEAIQELVGDRGNILLVREGYTFYKRTELQSGEMKWRCCNKKCLAKMYTFGIENQRRITKENLQHNHDKDEEKVKRKIVSGIAKRKAVEDSSSKPSEIIQKAIAETKVKRVDITHRDVKLIARNAYNARRKEQLSLLTSTMDHSSSSINLRLKEKQEAQAVHINVQEEETSGPSSFNIKQEITIDESDLDHLNFPKLEPVQNTSEVIDRVEGNCNINISPSTSNKFHEERKTNDKDNRIEDGDLLNTVRGEVENGDKYVEYGMYIANRLRNANQSDSAIDIAKQEIEVILNELERGIFTISLH